MCPIIFLKCTKLNYFKSQKVPYAHMRSIFFYEHSKSEVGNFAHPPHNGLRRILCNALIQPNFEYACSVWYPNLSKKLKNKLQIAQNKCIRFCLFLGNREGIRFKHFKQINWLPVADRVKQFIAVSAYKFMNDLSPKYMEDVFKKTYTRASRFANDVKLHIPHRNNEYGKNCLSYLGATIWNSLDFLIKQAKNCNTFKHRIKEKYFRDTQRREDNIYAF